MRITLNGKTKNKNPISVAEKRDRKLARFVCAYFLVLLLNTALKITFPMNEEIWNTLSVVFFVLLAMMLLGTFAYVVEREINLLILCELVVAFVFLISALMDNSDNVPLFPEYFMTAAVIVPVAICTCAIENKLILYETLLKSAYIASAMTFATYLGQGHWLNAGAYNMTIATNYLIFSMTIWSAVITKRNRSALNIFLAIYTLLYMLLFGNRGNLLCLLFFIGLRLVRLRGGRNKPILIAAVFGLLIIGVALLDKIVNLMTTLLSGAGRSSYIIMRLINGSFLDSNGRFELFDYYWNLSRQKPFFGWGVYGGYISVPLGPHNGAIELLLAFGLIFGGILVVLFAGMCVSTALSHEDGRIETELLLMFMATNIMRFVSMGGMLDNPYVAIYVFLYFQRKRKKNMRLSIVNNRLT